MKRSTSDRRVDFAMSEVLGLKNVWGVDAIDGGRGALGIGSRYLSLTLSPLDGARARRRLTRATTTTRTLRRGTRPEGLCINYPREVTPNGSSAKHECADSLGNMGIVHRRVSSPSALDICMDSALGLDGCSPIGWDNVDDLPLDLLGAGKGPETALGDIRDLALGAVGGLSGEELDLRRD